MGSPIAETVDANAAAPTRPFWWGTTATSIGAEGVAPAADWSRWEQTKRVPPSADGNGFATNYADDMALLASAGLTHQRITVEWARIEPSPGHVDRGALEHYRDVFAMAQEVGVQPWATLVNGSLPGWFSDDQRGFRDERGVGYHWARHVDLVAETLDGLAAGWCPIDDPVGMAIRGFVLGSRPPGRVDLLAAPDAIRGALEANFEAARLLRSGAAPVMGVFGLPTIFATRPEAQGAASVWESALWDSWINAITEGRFSVPGRAGLDRPEYISAFDVIGAAFDHPMAVDVDKHGVESFAPYPADGRVDASGFAPHTEELGVMVHRLAEHLPGVPLVLAGTGVSTNDEDWRQQLTGDVLQQVQWALDDGIDLLGCFFDTGIDGYNWGHGFHAPRGLFDRGRNAKPALPQPLPNF